MAGENTFLLGYRDETPQRRTWTAAFPWLALVVVAVILMSSVAGVQRHRPCTDAGEQWCPTANMCTPRGMCPASPLVGSDRDPHGCIPSAGYRWCEPLKACIRPWETECK
eukprot:Sspe_Gene.61976::Locus_34548_Transcript_1_1_Confidence_1.000_Length_525::g.61976::m.61976